jgi:hypothetical protein
MTTFCRILELRRVDAEELIERKPELRAIVGWPTIRWQDRAGIYHVWPNPIEGVEVLYDKHGVPAGFTIEEERPE